MISCSIYGCPNNVDNTDSSIQYYYFPKHPPITQQWLHACWSEDQIDLNTARICSIHFDLESYTTDYKMLDYNGVYAKLLKYDAIPTLYLPQSETIIKASVSDIDIATISAATQSKNINIFVVNTPQYIQFAEQAQDTAAIAGGASQPTAILAASELEFNIKVESPQDLDDPKYASIKTTTEWNQLNKENEELEKLRAEQEQRNDNLTKELEAKTNEFKANVEDFKKSETSLAKLKRRSLSLNDQWRLLNKVFSESQIKILMGKKKLCYWSNDDMAIGYTLRHISSKRFYMYVTKNLGIPMPALSSIKRWAYNKRSDFDKEDKEVKKEDLKNEDTD